MWERKWTKAVFDFDYQIEIYVPGPKRIYGYYVLPFVMGDRFAARVDLKADRKASTLIVHAAYVEARMDSRVVAEALAEQLRSMAAWLLLERLSIQPKGNLAKPLGGPFDNRARIHNSIPRNTRRVRRPCGVRRRARCASCGSGTPSAIGRSSDTRA